MIEVTSEQQRLAIQLTKAKEDVDRANCFDKWIESSRFGKMSDSRKGGSVIVFDYEGAEVKRYKLTNAWPKSLEIGSLKAGDTSVLTEKLVLTYERLEVE